MIEKVEALSKFKEFKQKVEKEIRRKIQCLRTNNRVEYQKSFQNTYMSVGYVDNSFVQALCNKMKLLKERIASC